MKIINAQMNILFKAIKEDKKIIEDMINKLSESYNLAKMEGKDSEMEDIPYSIPRIIGKSKHGHSQISISLNRAEISIVFDESFYESIENCITYIREKSKEVYDSLKSFVEERYLFSGITVTTIIDELNENPIDTITSKFVKIKAKKELYDVSTKFAYVKENHFININISNARGIEEIQDNINSSITKKVNYLSITFDVNDKYGFSEKTNYQSDYNKLVENIRLVERLCREEIPKLIKGEELDI